MADLMMEKLNKAGAGKMDSANENPTPASKKKTDAERLAAYKQQEAALKAKIARIETKTKDQERKTDTRRKIIIGSAVMAHAKIDKPFSDRLGEILKVAVIRDTDRELIKDFLK